MAERLTPKQRRVQIMDAALDVAERMGYHQMRREDIATKADVSNALVSKYFGTMKQMRRAVMRHAIKVERYKIIVQGLAMNDPTAKKADTEIKIKALESMS
jgi:AcrR family transcriptional regulator